MCFAAGGWGAGGSWSPGARAVVAAGLVGVILLAWLYLLGLGRDMQGMDMVAPMAMAAPWGPGELLAVFGMWAVMMVAMMLPSAAPMILLFATVNRRRAVDQTRPVPVAIFVAGYSRARGGGRGAA